MLALTRKKGESIIIGDDVEVVVLGVQGEQVKLGIIAPKAVSVHRREIYRQIQWENQEAARTLNVMSLEELIRVPIRKLENEREIANASGEFRAKFENFENGTGSGSAWVRE